MRRGKRREGKRWPPGNKTCFCYRQSHLLPGVLLRVLRTCIMSAWQAPAVRTIHTLPAAAGPAVDQYCVNTNQETLEAATKPQPHCVVLTGSVIPEKSISTNSVVRLNRETQAERKSRSNHRAKKKKKKKRKKDIQVHSFLTRKTSAFLFNFPVTFA